MTGDTRILVAMQKALLVRAKIFRCSTQYPHINRNVNLVTALGVAFAWPGEDESRNGGGKVLGLTRPLTDRHGHRTDLDPIAISWLQQYALPKDHSVRTRGCLPRGSMSSAMPLPSWTTAKYAARSAMVMPGRRWFRRWNRSTLT